MFKGPRVCLFEVFSASPFAEKARYEQLSHLSAPLRLEALRLFSASYKEVPSYDHLYLVALVLWRPLDALCAKYESVVSPSEVLFRLAEGLQRGKRSLMRWVKRWADKRLARLATQGVLVETLPDVGAEQVAPSDPWLKAQLTKGWALLTSKEKEAAELLYLQGLTQAEAAAKINIKIPALKKRVESLRAKLAGMRDL